MFFVVQGRWIWGAVDGKSVMLRWAEGSSYVVIPRGNPACVQYGLEGATSLPEFASGGKTYLSLDSKNFCSIYFDLKKKQTQDIKLWLFDVYVGDP